MPTTANVLLVEGPDDKHVCYALFDQHSIRGVSVEDVSGIDTLVDELDVWVAASGLVNLGIVIDTDVNLNARWESLRGKLISCGYAVIPNTPERNGTIIEQAGLAKVGIWLMPDNAGSGILEHFVELMISDDDDLWSDAKATVVHLGDRQRFPAQHLIKAQIYTWLAWQEQPGKRIGTAIKARYLDAQSPSATVFVDWVRLLFLNG